MAIQILKGDRQHQEKRIGRYMQEIRDIVQGGFHRRELLKMGLVMGGAGLLAMRGMRNFRPYWAHAEDSNNGIRVISPPNTPFVDRLPIPAVMQRTRLDPAPTKGPNPAPSALTGFTETKRPDHQRWTQFRGTSDMAPGFTGAMYEILELPFSHDFYPAIDGVGPSTIWTYADAATTPPTPGPLWIQAHYRDDPDDPGPIVLRVHNSLPIANEGFGINQTTTHLHGGHVASESDGGPVQFYDFGQFKDFHYPNARAGFASSHPTSSLNGKTIIGDVHETQSFLWFHDHRFDFTAQNTYKGLASFYTLFSDDILLDTGDETTGLRLPSGPFDIPMIFADKVFDPTSGQLFFDLFNLAGILGDKYTVNGKIQPYLDVAPRRYRFRLLNGGPSRVYEFFLSNGQQFIQLSNDGNLLPEALARTSIRVSVAERVDVIVDFTSAKPGDKIYLQNRLQQNNGAGPLGNLGPPTNLVEFRVVGSATDNSQIPTKLLDLPVRPKTVRSREWEFDEDNGLWVINDQLFNPDVIRAFPKQNTAEVWTLKSGGEWHHPVHIHLEEFVISGGQLNADERARKDVVRIGEGSVGGEDRETVQLIVQFRDWLGDYPMHCHNTVHEDHAMMLRWQVVQ
jgi:FtsP/CotA-like multicopper oxidase with cupredoxin domain